MFACGCFEVLSILRLQIDFQPSMMPGSGINVCDGEWVVLMCKTKLSNFSSHLKLSVKV